MNSVGIDVSKEKSMVCILRPYGEIILSPSEIQHTDQDLEDLSQRILSLEGECCVVMEATGAYNLPVLTYFREAGIFVSVVNPLMMKKYGASAISKGKTDKMDSMRIANYGIDNWFKLVEHQPQDDAYEELKLLGRQYAHYIDIKVESKLVLNGLLDRTMPGIKKLISAKNPNMPTKDKLNDFVTEYWHFHNITSMTEDEFIIDYCRWAKEYGYHQRETKAVAIYKMATNAITTMPCLHIH